MRVKPSTAQHRASLAWLCCPTERQRSASTGFAVVRLPLPPPAPWPAPNIWAYPFFWVLRNFRTKHVAEPHFCLSLSGARVCFVCACGPHLPLAYPSRNCKHVLPMLGQPIFFVSSTGPFLWSKYLVRQISSSRSDGACQKCFPNPLFCPLPE